MGCSGRKGGMSTNAKAAERRRRSAGGGEAGGREEGRRGGEGQTAQHKVSRFCRKRHGGID